MNRSREAGGPFERVAGSRDPKRGGDDVQVVLLLEEGVRLLCDPPDLVMSGKQHRNNPGFGGTTGGHLPFGVGPRMG